MKRRLLALVLSTAAFAAFAQSGWRQPDGTPLPETPSSRTVDGFSASLLLTPDRDWEAKWNTPHDVVPHFSSADTVALGGELNILMVFGNPARDAGGRVDIRCDLQMVRPDGSLGFDAKDIACFQATLPADATGVFMTTSNLKFVAEAGDPLGTYTVRAVLHDRVRGASVPLEATFAHVAPGPTP